MRNQWVRILKLFIVLFCLSACLSKDGGIKSRDINKLIVCWRGSLNNSKTFSSASKASDFFLRNCKHNEHFLYYVDLKPTTLLCYPPNQIILSTLLPVTSPIFLLLFYQGSSAAEGALESPYSGNHPLHIATSIWNSFQQSWSSQSQPHNPF